MDREEIKRQIKEKKIDRRLLAGKIGVSANHLSAMLNGWSPFKSNYERTIMEEIARDRCHFGIMGDQRKE